MNDSKTVNTFLQQLSMPDKFCKSDSWNEEEQEELVEMK